MKLNIEPFAYYENVDEPGRLRTLHWDEMRDIHRIVLHFAAPVPDARKTVKVEYWRHSWPESRPETEDVRAETAGSHGWKKQDDWFNGKWHAAETQASATDSTVTVAFRPLAETEFPELSDYNVTFRRTLKLRITVPQQAPDLERIEVFTDTPVRPAEIAVELGCGLEIADPWKDAAVEVYNGRLRKLQTSDDAPAKAVINVVCAQAGPLSNDRTIITVRSPAGSFSFSLCELLEGGAIWAPDLRALVTRAQENVRYSPEFVESLKTGKCVYDRVLDMPEQSLSRAVSSMPAKTPMHFIIGCEGARQKFGVCTNGDVFGMPTYIRTIPGRDTGRLPWKGDAFTLRFGLDDAPVRERSLERGYLPIVRTVHACGSVEIEETAFASPLEQSILDGEIEGDDPLVAMIRMRFVNAGSDSEAVHLRIRVATYDKGHAHALSCNTLAPRTVEKLRLDGGLVYGSDGQAEYLRFAFDSGDAGELSLADGEVFYEAELAPGGSSGLVIKLPYIALETNYEIAQLEGKDFDRERHEVSEFWRKRIDEGAGIITPEQDVNDFYRAHLTHILINDDFEVGSDRIVGRVSSFHYGNFTNESCMQIADLDRRGYHDLARRHLETYLHYQGTAALPGNFESTDGVFYGSGGYEAGGYNFHHPWALWCLAHHYHMTGDGDWLLKIAPKLVAGCDWIVTERRATKRTDACGHRVLEYGFMPAGALEDVQDYFYWLGTNGFMYWGLNAAAQALCEVGHPDGARLKKDADDYLADIRRAVREAMIRSPLVRLRDGTYVPHIPSRLYFRGRDLGWIRETLEGSINLIGTGVIDPASPEATWTLKDFEDNRYIGIPYGYDVGDFERWWFDRGGFSMQPNLVYWISPYLLRDEIEHFLRSFFNAFAAGWRGDIRSMTEHPLPTLADWSGDHFKSSDEAMVTYWLRLMFIREDAGDLYLGQAIPRYWLADGRTPAIRNAATRFGPMSLEFESRAAAGKITATLDPPRRRPPDRIFLRFRHPDKARMSKVLVNGKPWPDFDPAKEWGVLPALTERTIVEAVY